MKKKKDINNKINDSYALVASLTLVLNVVPDVCCDAIVEYYVTNKIRIYVCFSDREIIIVDRIMENESEPHVLLTDLMSIGVNGVASIYGYELKYGYDE